MEPAAYATIRRNPKFQQLVEERNRLARVLSIVMLVMLLAANPVGDFVNNHPTVKMLALSFLLLVGVALIADGLQFHIPRGYLYFAIAFSALVEGLNLLAAKARRKRSSDAPPMH